MTLMEGAKQAGTSLMHGGKAMAGPGEIGKSSSGGRWRIGLWILGAGALLVPLAAMRFTDEVEWTAFDFVVAGAMIFGTLGLFEIAARMSGNLMYRAASGIGLLTGLGLLWSNLAVGVIGDEGNPANLMFLALLAAGGSGAALVRFRAREMSWVMGGLAGGQAAIGAFAMSAGLGLPESGVFELLWLSAFFTALWLVSAGLFRVAASGSAQT